MTNGPIVGPLIGEERLLCVLARYVCEHISPARRHLSCGDRAKGP